MSMQRYLVRRLSKLREVLQPFSNTRLPAVDMDDSEEPKSKRPRIEDAGENDGTGEGNEVLPQVWLRKTSCYVFLQESARAGPRFAKRRKCILLMAYNGKGYMGMQR